MKCLFCGETFAGVFSRTTTAEGKRIILIGCPMCLKMLGAVGAD